MASATFVPSRLFGGDFTDVEAPNNDDDGKVLMWNKDLTMAVWKTLAEVAAYNYTPSLNFSDARNSMYIPIVQGF
jgi:hypothetical protein